MQCPECGYQLTPFDKDCPRCKNFASRGLKAVKPEPVELNFEATPTDTQPTPTSIVDTEETFSRPVNRKRVHPVLVVVVGLLVLLLGSVWVLSQQTREAGSTGAGAVQQDASRSSKVERVKSEGVQQCIAGDEEGCTYAMDKLRDADDYDSAEYLKLHLIVSLTLNDQQFKYRGNAGATIAEYEAYSKKLASDAELLALQGNSDYKIPVKGSECAKTLAEYGRSHKLTGRY